MAAVRSKIQDGLPVADKEVLTDEKIQSLLLEAEQRLLNQSLEISRVDANDNDLLTLAEEPKVDTRVRYVCP